MIDWIFQGVVTIAIVLLCHLICRAGDLRRRAVAELWARIWQNEVEIGELEEKLSLEADMRQARVFRLNRQLEDVNGSLDDLADRLQQLEGGTP